MKFMIVNAFGRSNRGDSVLLDECIHEIAVNDPDATIKGAVFEGIADAAKIHPRIQWSARIGNADGGGAVQKLKALVYLLAAYGATLAPWSGLARLLPPAQQQTLAAIRDADVVISAPGGYIHDTNFAYFIALAHIHLASILGKIVILAPQSVGPIERPFSKYLARKVLGRVQYLCARESYSYGFLTKDLGLKPATVYRTGDSAFWNEHVEDDSALIDGIFASFGLVESAPIFGITVVGWSFPKSVRPQEDYDLYTSAVAKAADHMSETYGLTPVIFNQVSSDLPTALEIAKKARHPVLIDKTGREPDILRAMIARSTVFLGTRFHSCIFAMMAGRPTFAISYLPKTEYIMNDLKLSTRHTPIDAIDMGRLLSKISSDYEGHDQACGEIRNAVSAYRQNYARLQDILALACPMVAR